MLRAFRSPVAAYATAIGAVALAAAARAAVGPLVGDRVPFATFYVALVAVAFFGNLGAALLATGLSAAAGLYLSTPTVGVAFQSLPHLVSVALFIVTGGMVSLLTYSIGRTRERMRATAEAESEQRRLGQAERLKLRDLIESIPGVVWEAWGEPDSSRQRMNFVSPYVQTMLGYTPGEWTAQPNFWLELVAPEDREAAARVASETFASGGSGVNEFRWITKDGRRIWVMARSSVIKDDSGAPAGMRGVTFDITDRKEVERRLELLSEISTSGLATPLFNDLATQIARRTADVVGDYCIIRMVRGDQLDCVAYAHVLPDAEPLVREIARSPEVAADSALYTEIIRNPKTLVDNDVPASGFDHVDRQGMEELFERFRARRGILCPLLSHGTLLGTLALGRAGGRPYDESDIRLAEAIASRAALALDNARLFETAHNEAAQARSARAQAEEAGRVKDEFLATLSHELRTPLNAILGWAHMLRDPALPDDRRRAAVETIVRNAQSQEQLISDILDVQRIMAGKIRLTLRTVDLGNIVRAAAETVQPSADAKGIRLQLLVDLDVPPSRGDPDRLQQVVWNLLSNAIKFAPQGGRVNVRLLKEEVDNELVVEDNGPGINPEFIPFMFERFRQADSSTTRTHKGLGLGLAIVRSLVEMHGGTITAANTSDPERTGAVFTIRLPRQASRTAAAQDDDAGWVDDSPHWLGEAPSLDGLRVLVVEDDGDARELVGAILERCGAQVTLTSSAAEGVDAFSRQRPDVVVSDIEMPDEDGYTLIRRIRALDAEAGGGVPVAALTAYASSADRMKVLGAGFNIHVPKPVQPAELAIVVASLAGRRV